MPRHGGALADPAALKAAKKDGQALERLMPEAERFVWRMYWRYFRQYESWLSTMGMTRYDLFQEGMIGFLKALRRFDPRHGTRFTTFAGSYVMGAMRAALRDRGFLIHIPRRFAERFGYILTAEQAVAQVTGQMRPADVAALARMTEAEVSMCIYAAQPLPLDEPIRGRGEQHGDRDRTLSEVLGTSGLEDEVITRIDLRRALARLPVRMRQALLLYACGYTQVEAAKLLNVSQARVSALVAKARQRTLAYLAS